MILQPILPLPVLVPVTLIVSGMVIWLCWKACRDLGLWLKLLCVLLALLATFTGLLLLLNPGHLEERPSANAPVWIVAKDISASMACPVHDDAAAESRIEVAGKVVERLASAASERDVRWVALAGEATTLAGARELAEHAANGTSSPVMDSLEGYIETLQRSGRTVAGVVLISDGRDTRPQALLHLIARAVAADCPVHVVPLGGAWQAPDLVVTIPRPLVMAYPGVETQLAAEIRNTRMGARQVVAELLDATGKVLQSKAVRIDDGVLASVAFPLSGASGEYSIRVNPQQGESREDNNAARVIVRAVESRIRIYLAEGAPYWDSKFLAQYLREQPVFDVRSVHRLSDKRFYHINSGDNDSTPSERPDMPTTAEKLAGYDIVVLGKSMERLMDAQTVHALRSFVSEQGGILVLSRGRCYGGRLEGMEELEPFIWAPDRESSEQCLQPARDGIQTGLFGNALPGAEHEVWALLPALDDVVGVKECRAGTRVLAHSAQGDIPMLGVMRAGLGAVVCLNGEGLWKWDFFPEARHHGNMYREFWRYFLPWIQTAAEFLPGFDLSLHVDRVNIREGDSVTCMSGWRGIGRPEELRVQAVNLADGKVVAEQAAVLCPSVGMYRWECRFASLPAGEYLLRAVAGDTPSPECRLTVSSLPTEVDNLNADSELLSRLAEATGGRVLTADGEGKEFLDVFAVPAGACSTENIFCPLWTRWHVLALMVGSLGLLWFIRRRKGLP